MGQEKCKMHDVIKECPKCKGLAVCGPFQHACEKCDPFQFEKCGNCGTKRIYCTC